LSSSFIEEEHQSWYLLETTQIYLFITFFIDLKSLKDRRVLFNLIGLLLIVRLSRSINQTGNKWIHLKDIGDILKEYILRNLI
jgi:hypothetical protein